MPLYEPLSPYIHTVDNQPIEGLITRVNLVNSQVDIITEILGASIGTQGTLANRLAQSIDNDGTLKAAAIDEALHSIAEHIDANGFVRMTDAERAKLSFITAGATNLQVDVQTISTVRSFSNETMVLQPSDSIIWRVSGDNVYADTNFPESARHGHYYGVTPVSVSVTPDYINYRNSAVAIPYQEGSLRVYVNGVRLNQASSVYVPTNLPSTVSWVALSYTEGTAVSGVVTGGGFAFSQAIPSTAVVTIDFDVLFS